MTAARRIAFCTFILGATSSSAVAQMMPAVRRVGSVVRSSTEALASVAQVRLLSRGRLLVNDARSRRVLLFDSTLGVPVVVADSASTAVHPYGSREGGLISYHGDSTLFVALTLPFVWVIDGNGRFVRKLSGLPSGDVQRLISGPYGTPAFDARGRLIYCALPILHLKVVTALADRDRSQTARDSALILRLDLISGTVDTVARVAFPAARYAAGHSASDRTALTPLLNPLPRTDDWAVLSDGTIAIVRGREYRVELINTDGVQTRPRPLPFDWHWLTPNMKAEIIDSAKAELAKARAEQPTRVAPPVLFVSANEITDYRPAFGQRAALGGADTNLWIRTTTVVDGGAVYDVVDKSGVLVDRVRVPRGRSIVAVGPEGMIYMAFRDGTRFRIETARNR